MKPSPNQPSISPWPLAAALGVAFALLALLAAFGEAWLAEVDRPVQAWALSLRRSWADPILEGATWLGSRLVIGPVLVALVIWMLATGRCRTLVTTIAVAVAATPLSELTLKVAIGRPRPEAARLVSVSGFAFPSGHALSSMVFYGLLGVLAWLALDRPRLRWAAVAVAGALVLVIGFSRVYLGVHWATDVAGGFLLGGLMVVVAREALRGHRPGRGAVACARGHGAVRRAGG